jgi:hypothetical protein
MGEFHRVIIRLLRVGAPAIPDNAPAIPIRAPAIPVYAPAIPIKTRLIHRLSLTAPVIPASAPAIPAVTCNPLMGSRRFLAS